MLPKQISATGSFYVGLNHMNSPVFDWWVLFFFVFFLTHTIGSFMWSNLIVMGTQVHCKPLAYGNEQNLSINIL